MHSKVPVKRWERVGGLQFVGQAYPPHTLSDSSPNYIAIDVASHRYTLNMQVSSGTKNNFSPNEPSCTTVTMSFNGALLVVTGTPGPLHMKVRRESDCKLNLDSSENITQDPCCGVHNACSLLQVNRRRQ
ncbi:uncharacterized protein TNCV_4592901 [Trichonephila clavipes]|nr:uncharacterized protein TNCV_4592901 [Trichonephila clavipes]